MQSPAVIMPIISIRASRSSLQLHSLQRAAGRISKHCSNCHLRQRCLPYNLCSEDIKYLDKLIHMRRLRKKEHLYRAGDDFKSLYAIHNGSFKTYAFTGSGHEQVTGFPMTADMMGMDGIKAGTHSLNAVALEDSVVCVIPFTNLEELAGQLPVLQHQFFKMMAAAMLRYQDVLLLLGGMPAEKRMAAFLISLSQRFAALGYSAKEFQLRMRREDIGSYLGLSIETVSRIFSRLHQKKLIYIHQKHLQIIDPAGLQQIAGIYSN